jgi:hypothetical protein
VKIMRHLRVAECADKLGLAQLVKKFLSVTKTEDSSVVTTDRHCVLSRANQFYAHSLSFTVIRHYMRYTAHVRINMVSVSQIAAKGVLLCEDLRK